MPWTGSWTDLQRRRRPGGHERVAFVELFFDLIFVFAVTQLSHTLLEHFTPRGFAEAGLLMLAVWWAWLHTCWVTNWMDPQRTSVRLLLFGLMLAGLLLSISIPEAFGERGLVFAAAFVIMQTGRSLFMVWALRYHNAGNYRNFQRIASWFAFSAILWSIGAFVEGDLRFAAWLAAITVECVAPATGFWTPWLGRSTTADWNVEGAHMAERCGLFVIIALGESVLVTGATFGQHVWTAEIVAAFVTAFVGTVAMWWVYFNIGADYASQTIARSSDPGQLARLAYTYVHIVIVAGIILAAVGDELVLAHPLGHLDIGVAMVLLGGPAVYLLGNLLFKASVFGRPPLSHIVGLALLLAQVALVPLASPLVLAMTTNATMVLVAIWETLSLRSRAAEIANGESHADPA